MFDIKSYLKDKGIAWRDSGKNISSGWIGISCPFCGESSNHLGISPDGTGFYCWVCSEKGNIVKLIKKIDNIPTKEALNIYYQYKTDTKPTQITTKKEKKTPRWYNSPLPIHIDYLEKKNYNLDIIEKYKLKFTYNIGYFKYRIIAPIYINGDIETFTARSVNNNPIRWIHQPGVNIKNYLYNIDNIKSKTVIIVEGVSDVWRIGDNSIAIFGKDISDEQVNILIRKGIKNLFILLDSDAHKESRRLAEKVSVIFNTEELLLDKGDPGDMLDEEVAILKKEIGI